MKHTIKVDCHGKAMAILTGEDEASKSSYESSRTIQLFKTHCENVTLLQTQLYSYALMLTRSQTAADDLLQDTMLRTLHGIDKYKPTGSFTAWTKKIMVNTFRNNARRTENHSTQAFENEIQHIDYAPDVEELYCGKELLKVIMHLPPRQRIIMALRIKGYRYNEIAEELGTTIGNVKSCIHQARNNIRRMMQE